MLTKLADKNEKNRTRGAIVNVKMNLSLKRLVGAGLGAILSIFLPLFAVAEVNNIDGVAGEYAFDLQNSELTQPYFRRYFTWILKLKSQDFESIDSSDVANLEYFGIISARAFVSDQDIVNQSVWRMVNEEEIDTNDAYDRTPLLIDENGVFFTSMAPTEKLRL